MVWRCSGTSNASLVDNLARSGICRSPRVEAALRSLDRGNYVLDRSAAYQDSPQHIGHGVTISAPHMHATCLELLEPFLRPGMRALDCGSGSGYLTAAMMAMVTEGGARGAAFGIEYMDALVPWSLSNVKRDKKEQWLSDPSSFQIRGGDGSQGWAEKGPFNAIHVGAAAPQIPRPLVEQLSQPGRMVIPVGQQHMPQELVVVDKAADGSVSMSSQMGVQYVPFHMKGTDAFSPSPKSKQ
uniref:Protein-L-isoaspartate O-methyltransferase n=1 Tax=Alexandrium catenella TaxID=2925 RepID=A0A7S1WLQ5_ALECA|mmetsp:Transcript_72275/g.191992  ORF Transcript_72275/g.191992 Transcript_72275/m.191992 type:complete len:240 (+) Transcript_72275:55-774(+)